MEILDYIVKQTCKDFKCSRCEDTIKSNENYCVVKDCETEEYCLACIQEGLKEVLEDINEAIDAVDLLVGENDIGKDSKDVGARKGYRDLQDAARRSLNKREID